jgi:hypothetical protein
MVHQVRMAEDIDPKKLSYRQLDMKSAAPEYTVGK